MHTKGSAAKRLKSKLGLDLCIYLGNDLNDISMFSNALDDNDFIVIAKKRKTRNYGHVVRLFKARVQNKRN